MRTYFPEASRWGTSALLSLMLPVKVDNVLFAVVPTVNAQSLALKFPSHWLAPNAEQFELRDVLYKAVVRPHQRSYD